MQCAFDYDVKQGKIFLKSFLSFFLSFEFLALFLYLSKYLRKNLIPLCDHHWLIDCEWRKVSLFFLFFCFIYFIIWSCIIRSVKFNVETNFFFFLPKLKKQKWFLPVLFILSLTLSITLSCRRFWLNLETTTKRKRIQMNWIGLRWKIFFFNQTKIDSSSFDCPNKFLFLLLLHFLFFTFRLQLRQQQEQKTLPPELWRRRRRSRSQVE